MQTEYSWLNSSKQRYYNIRFAPDMLNEFVVLCSWGSCVTRLGNSKIHAFDTQSAVVEFIEMMTARRLRRGYLLRR